MFRRKEEDSLFDNTTDPNQAKGAESTPASSSPSSASSSSSAASGSNYSTPASQPGRPSTDRPAAPASSFRAASAPVSGDISRNRMPDTKSAPIPPASTMSVGGTNSAKGANGRRVLTVGNDILLKGEIATCDRLVIEGKVDATLNDVHTVEIAENGSFKGSAHIEDAEISGLFEGDLIVRNRLVIYASGKVRGKITYGEIEIERGGELTGEIKTSNQAAGAGRPRSPKDDKAAA